MEKPVFAIFLNDGDWSFELYLEDGNNILNCFEYYDNPYFCLRDIKYIQEQNNYEGTGQWADGWTENGEKFWYCEGINREPIATTLYTTHNKKHDFQKLPSLLFEKIKIAQIVYSDPLDNPIWAKEANSKLLKNIFLFMMTNQDQNIYYNKLTKDIEQETNGYLSSHLAENQKEENTILMDRILQNAPKDDIIPELHFRIPRISLESFCSTLKDRGFNIRKLGSFIDEFVEVQKETSSQHEVYFNEYRTNLLLSQLNEWCTDTGTDINLITALFDEAGKLHAVRFLDDLYIGSSFESFSSQYRNREAAEIAKSAK